MPKQNTPAGFPRDGRIKESPERVGGLLHGEPQTENLLLTMAGQLQERRQASFPNGKEAAARASLRRGPRYSWQVAPQQSLRPLRGAVSRLPQIETLHKQEEYDAASRRGIAMTARPTTKHNSPPRTIRAMVRHCRGRPNNSRRSRDSSINQGSVDDCFAEERAKASGRWTSIHTPTRR